MVYYRQIEHIFIKPIYASIVHCGMPPPWPHHYILLDL